MNNLYQIDVEDPTSWLLFYRLRDMFENAAPDNPVQTFESFKQIMGDVNNEDLERHPDSPYRHRPAYLDDPEFKMK